MGHGGRTRLEEQWFNLLCAKRDSHLFWGYDLPSSRPCSAATKPAQASSGSSVFPAAWLLPCKTGTWGHNPCKLFLTCCTHGTRPGRTCDIFMTLCLQYPELEAVAQQCCLQQDSHPPSKHPDGAACSSSLKIEGAKASLLRNTDTEKCG